MRLGEYKKFSSNKKLNTMRLFANFAKKVFCKKGTLAGDEDYD